MDAREAMTEAWHTRTSGRFRQVRPAPLQRANRIALPGLAARPWWDARAFPFVRELEGLAPEIAREIAALRARGYFCPRPIASIPPDARVGDQQLIEGETGGWEIFRLHYNGLWFEDNGALCPATMRALRAVPGLAGTAGIGVLLGGTRIRAHCGLSNAKLRCHLGLDVPSGCGIRVAEETRSWQNGRCLLFDDSFQHAVWNDSVAARVVLLFDVVHPDLGPDDAAWVTERALPRREKHEAIRDAARWQPVARTPAYRRTARASERGRSG